MGLIVSFGDYGVGDDLDEIRAIRDFIVGLSLGYIKWDDVLEKPELYVKSEVFNKEEILALLEALTPGAHTHVIADVTGLQEALDDRYTIEETDNLLEGKSDIDHTHPVSDIVGLEEAIQSLGVQIVSELPIPVENGRIYMWHPEGADRFTPVISANGAYVQLDAVTYSALSTALASKQNKLTGLPTQYVKGDGTYGTFNKASIGLGNVDNTSDADKPLSNAATTALNSKANDADVLKKTGNQTKTSGVLTFVNSPVVPIPQNSQDAANKGYVDSVSDSVNLWNDGEAVEW